VHEPYGGGVAGFRYHGGVWRWLAIFCAAGCKFTPGGVAIDAADDGAGSADTSTDVPPADAQTCYAVSELGVSFCLDAPATGSLGVGQDTSINTDTGISIGTAAITCATLQASASYCVVAAAALSIDGGVTLSAHGARPLVLLASTITVTGTIDVASHIGGQQGPASDLPGCAPGANPTANGGGQGGSLGGLGGDGGDSSGATNSGGTAGAVIAVTTLRGGCPSVKGAGSNGTAAHGGGAVLLIADTIVVADTGVINASGASGVGANTSNHGGTGAGSGGVIAFSTPNISLVTGGQIFANGGHAGSGSSGSAGVAGTDPTGSTSGGGGGNSGTNAGNGGPGFPGSSRNGSNGTSGDGGGGGGGGAGVVRVVGGGALPVTTDVSPPAT